jgi:hypothetical protein
MKLEAGKEYLLNNGRKAKCLAITDDNRCAMEIEGRKMIETYGIDGTFRIASDSERDEGLHVASEYVPPLTIWAVVSGAKSVVAISVDGPKFDDNTTAKGRLVRLVEVRT